MNLDDAIKVEKAEQDSHFRLLCCPECGSDNVAYVQYKHDAQEPWKVICFDCGYTVDKQAIFRHEAQVTWNKECKKRRDNPCMDCPDRYTACSDHCQKACFRAWKEEHRRILMDKAKDRDIDNYVIREIGKNRRVR